MNSKISDQEISETSHPKEEPDSGVDNNSDSGRSAEDDQHAISSDYEELLSSDNESGSGKNEETEDVMQKEPATVNGFDTSENYLQTDSGKPDISIELNQEFLKDEYKDAVNFFKDLGNSHCETVDFSGPSVAKKPDWYDEKKFKRGQKFARDNLFSINFAELLSLIILFAQKASLTPLIFTGKSDTPYKAFRRYFSTLTRLMSWYEDDIWDDAKSLGKRNLNIVRGMHKNVYEKLKSSSPEELARKTTLGDPSTTALWCPLKDVILKDFNQSLPASTVEYQHYEERLSGRTAWINQADMAIVQFAFVGMAVTYPEYFGLHLASDEDLDGFLHLWRCLGYLLGMKDKYNYCNSDLKSVRLRTKFYLDVLAIPGFKNVTYDWEHMCRCLTAGISYYLPMVNFESCLLYLCHIFKIDTPRLKKEISFFSYLVFQIHRLTFYLMKFESVLKWLNSRLYVVIGKVQNASPEVLAKWENRQFPFMNQPGKCPIRSSPSYES